MHMYNIKVMVNVGFLNLILYGVHIHEVPYSGNQNLVIIYSFNDGSDGSQKKNDKARTVYQTAVNLNYKSYLLHQNNKLWGVYNLSLDDYKPPPLN